MTIQVNEKRVLAAWGEKDGKALLTYRTAYAARLKKARIDAAPFEDTSPYSVYWKFYSQSLVVEGVLAAINSAMDSVSNGKPFDERYRDLGPRLLAEVSLVELYAKRLGYVLGKEKGTYAQLHAYNDFYARTLEARGELAKLQEELAKARREVKYAYLHKAFDNTMTLFSSAATLTASAVSLPVTFAISVGTMVVDAHMGKVPDGLATAKDQAKGKVPDAAEYLMKSLDSTAKHAETSKHLLGGAQAIFELGKIADVDKILDAKETVEWWSMRIRNVKKRLDEVSTEAARLRPGIGKLREDLLSRHRAGEALDKEITALSSKIGGMAMSTGLWFEKKAYSNAPYYEKHVLKLMHPRR